MVMVFERRVAPLGYVRASDVWQQAINEGKRALKLLEPNLFPSRAFLAGRNFSRVSGQRLPDRVGYYLARRAGPDLGFAVSAPSYGLRLGIKSGGVPNPKARYLSPPRFPPPNERCHPPLV